MGNVGNVTPNTNTVLSTGGGIGAGGAAGAGTGAPNTGLYSDSRLKENINKVGISKTGIPIYEFNYRGLGDRYRGAMAQDLLKLGKTDAVNKDNNGFYMVDYNKIDVEFIKIKK